MKISVADLLPQIPGALTSRCPEGERFAVALEHGSIKVELYVSDRIDLQAPHRQDELYVMVAGEGEFICDDARTHFGPGDVLLVPAGVSHRFENFSDDFVTWVIFFGPDGGEQR